MRGTATGSQILNDNARTALRALVDDGGEQFARRHLGIARATLERALAALPIRPGSSLLITTGLRKRAMTEAEK
jgi:hypothetical protein